MKICMIKYSLGNMKKGLGLGVSDVQDYTERIPCTIPCASANSAPAEGPLAQRLRYTIKVTQFNHFFYQTRDYHTYVFTVPKRRGRERHVVRSAADENWECPNRKIVSRGAVANRALELESSHFI